MNVILWVLQVVGALGFIFAGALLVSQPKAKLRESMGMGWVDDYEDYQVKAIGALEILGALALVLPWWIDYAKVLTPVAALCLTANMIGALVTHVRRNELALVGPSVFLLVVSVVVLIGRFVVE
jgi:hypothetical protein